MDGCKVSPRPSGLIDIVAACASDAGMRFAGQRRDHNFVGAGGGINNAKNSGNIAQRLLDSTAPYGPEVGPTRSW